MNLERGFRRVFVVLSLAVLGFGIAIDVGTLWSHAKIYATLYFRRLSFGEHTELLETWNLVGSSPYEEDPATRHMVVGLLRKAADLGELSPAFLEWAESQESQFGARTSHELDDLCPEANALFIRPQELRILRMVCLSTFRVVRGPAAWSWKDFQFTRISAGLVVLLWAGFFTVRWIARGFVPQQTR